MPNGIGSSVNLRHFHDALLRANLSHTYMRGWSLEVNFPLCDGLTLLSLPVVMRRAIEHVVSDQRFHIRVEAAVTALGVAKSVLERGVASAIRESFIREML